MMIFLVLFALSISIHISHCQVEKPEILVECENLLTEDRECSVNFRDNETIILADLNQYYIITCTAEYLLGIDVNIPNQQKPYLKLQRNVRNVLENSTYTHELEYSFATAQGSSGDVTIRNVENPRIFSRIHFFVEVGKAFTNSGKTINVKYNEIDSVIPCPSNYADLVPILEQRHSHQEPYQRKNWTFDPKIGFVVDVYQNLTGEFKCESNLDSEDFVLIRYGDNGTDTETGNFTGMPKFFFPTGRTDLVCNEEHRRNLTKLEDIRCDHPSACDMHRNCFQTEECSATKLVGKYCLTGDCIITEQAHPFGIAMCQAGETKIFDYHFMGFDKKQYLLSQGNFPERALIYMNDVNPVLYTDEPGTFYCQAIAFLFTEKIQFSVVYKNGTKSSLPDGRFERYTREELEATIAFGAVQNGIRVNLTEDMREIICHAPWYNSSSAWYTKSRKFTVLSVKAPSILRSNTAHLFYKGDTGRTLICKAEGHPAPIFKWYQNESEIVSASGLSIINTEAESVLQFPEVNLSYMGIYECKASNRVGKDSVTFRVDVRESRVNSLAIGLVTIFLTVIFVVAVVTFYRMRNKYLDAKIRLRNLTAEEIEQFEKGNPEMLSDDDAGIQDNAQFLPFNENYKLLDQDVIIDKTSILGKGAFGLVVRGKYLGDPVAVKTTLPNAEVSYFKALLSELKVMAYIGSHPNVVHFIGAVTNRIKERIVYVIVELSPLGNLESFLKSHRTTYVNFVVNNKIVKTELPYVNVIKRVTTLDFVNWCHQIASGMEYLSKKKVIHGDLATRNVLLFHGDVAKITDFGLSRQIYENTNYTKKNQTPLPWRWLAIESLRDMEFSTKSDVWAFAVTAWEIFTMAEIPYPGLCWSMDFIEHLEEGMRPPKPKFATEEIYSMMVKCWEPEADKRPSFGDLKCFFEDLLTDFQAGSVSINLERAIYSNYCG